MKKLVLVIALSLTLAGCNTTGVNQLFTFFSTGYQNPVSKETLYQFENALTIAFAGLKAYRQACLAGTVDVHCKDNIRAMQVYTRQIPPILADVRGFVKNNDMVNAQIAFDNAKKLYADFSAIAQVNNVKVQ